MQPFKVIISGGGTGGHIFPALAIAKGIRERDPNSEILFVGAIGKMEMEKVPEHGFEIVGLKIAGLQRKLSFQNLLLPFKVVKTMIDASRIIKRFKPEIAVGVGGYASAPLLYAAQLKGLPTLIQEQNSFAGLTNKWLSSRASKICVAFDGMDKYFPQAKIVKTGNPVRKDITGPTKEEALQYFNLNSSRPVLLIIGGSLGARTINQSVAGGLNQLHKAGLQVIWQTGRSYYPLAEEMGNDEVKVNEFIKRMDLAYAAADLVISRAGALSIAELCLCGKPCILVPSPNVAEDHQTKNAMALVKENAAILVNDEHAHHELINQAIALASDRIKMQSLASNIKSLARPDAVDSIVDEIFKLRKNEKAD